jgi:signal transduction histidine kinase
MCADSEAKRLADELKREREDNRAKSLFINVISHELRTPLAIIRGAADLLEHCHHRLSDAERVSYIQSIKRSILRITRTMDSVLILGKVQNNQLSFQPLKADVARVCKNIANEMEELNDGRRVVMLVSKNFPGELTIDTTLLYHIVSNLLSNAMKYSATDTLVYLGLDYKRGLLTIRVKDFGIGIVPSDLDVVFKPFQRGSNIGNRKGNGIGMFIVRHCVSLHNGSIDVNSKEGVGTTFRVTLTIPD